LFQDPYAVATLSRLVRDYRVHTIIETGTYHGDSTIRFLDFVNDVVTVDILPMCIGWTAGRLSERGFSLDGEPGKFMLMRKGDKRVKLYVGNSPEVIRNILERLWKPLLFFLDAHWFSYWPLKDEIRAIKPRPNSLIIVHDIQVPGKDFQFDAYAGQTCNYDLIEEDLSFVNNNYNIFYNKEAGGNRVGILYAVPPRGDKNAGK